MAKAYITSLPNTTDTQRAFVKTVDSPKVPAMDYRSGFKDVATAINNTNQFLEDYSKMKYEGFQADLDKLELEHLHEMSDASDPCELEQINEKWKKNYDSALKDDFWAKSYYKSQHYKNWQARNQEAQQKIYFAKQHEFAEICATDTLNKMAETASLLDNPLDMEQYVLNGKAMLDNTKHLTADAKHKLMTNFYKDTVSRIYESDPNKAVAFLDHVGNKYDGYGVGSEEIRKKADKYNKAKAKELKAETALALKLQKEQEVLYGQNVLAQYNRGLTEKSTAEDLLYSRGMETGNFKAYNDFMKATKPKSSKDKKGIDTALYKDYLEGAKNIVTKSELDKYTLDFFTSHGADMDAGTRTAINDLEDKFSSNVINFTTGTSSSSKSTSTSNKKTEDKENYPYPLDFPNELANLDKTMGEGSAEVAANIYSAKNNFNPTQRSNLVNTVKSITDVEKKKSTNEKTAFETQIENVEYNEGRPSNQLNDYIQLESKISESNVLFPSDRQALLKSISEKKKKILGDMKIKQDKQNEDVSKQEKNALEVEMVTQTQNMIDRINYNPDSTNDEGVLSLLKRTDEAISSYQRAGVISKENANSLHSQVQNKRNFLLDARLQNNNIAGLDIGYAEYYNPKDPDSALSKIAAHNSKIYANEFHKELDNIVNDYVHGNVDYDTALSKVRASAEAKAVSVDTATKDFDNRTNDLDFAKKYEDIENVWKRAYGYVNDKDVDAVYAYNLSKGSFYNEVAEAWNKNKALGQFTFDYIQNQAEKSRASDYAYSNSLDRVRTGANVVVGKFYTKDNKIKYSDADKPLVTLTDFHFVSLAHNNPRVDNDKISTAYNRLIPYVQKVLKDSYGVPQKAGGWDTSFNPSLAGGAIRKIAQMQGFNSDTPSLEIDFDSTDYAAIYESIIPYLESNGWGLDSEIGATKVQELANAAFYDKFTGINTNINFGGRLITQEEVKNALAKTTNIIRPREITYGARK